MNFFEQELRKLFENCAALTDPRFAGRVCMARLTDTANVKPTFVTLGFADKYEAIEAKIINRNEGPIDTAVFWFADILGRKPVPGNPNFKDGVFPHFWRNGGKYEWYAYKPTPKDFEMIECTVSGYLEMFREPVQSQGMAQRMG